jgi:DNA (cytosine-5)-methyltransferase 1
MNVLDLFSGIGGFSLGLERAGMKTVAFCEIEEYPRKVLAKHWPNIPIYNDVRELTGDRLKQDGISVDVISGGFPCQDISVGHTWREARGLQGERSGLWSEIVRLVDDIRPQFLIAENVAALRGRGLTQCLQDLWSVGYDAEWHIIPAAAVGLDHQRERVWIIAYPTGQRIQGLWAEGQQITRPLDKEFLSIRDSNGQWKVEPDVCRVADGVSRRVDRLKAIGNAVVPQIPELIGRTIMEATHAIRK